MKNRQIILLVGFLFLLIIEKAYCQIDKISPDSVINKEFKIVKIDSIKNVYMIYAERNDSVFKIISIKEDIGYCQCLRLNSVYVLSVVSYFPPIVIKERIAGVRYGDTQINRVEENDGKNVLKDLYLSNDIKSKCYVRENNVSN